MGNENAYQSGTLKISEEVILTIAKHAISDIKGVEEIVPVNESGIKINLEKNYLKDGHCRENIWKDNLIKVKLVWCSRNYIMVIVKQGHKVTMIANHTECGKIKRTEYDRNYSIKSTLLFQEFQQGQVVLVFAK